ncbi:hypothetical protein E3Q12_02574 [Wallemia mellicola]|nr:hypothetical protein E3Q12_02574 [Wallemia mellicola]
MASSNILDHLSEFVEAGFTVIDGGKHADGITENALIVLSDGVYIELIAYIHGVTKSDHFWGDKKPGWIDYACLGVKEQETGIEEFYEKPIHGGRTLSDGRKAQWVVSFPIKRYPRGSVPFYCQDKTPREIRVPSNKSEHSNNVKRVKSLILLCNETALKASVLLYNSILQQLPHHQSEQKVVYKLKSPANSQIELILRTPVSPEEEAHVFANHGDCIQSIEVEGAKTSSTLKPSNGGGQLIMTC